MRLCSFRKATYYTQPTLSHHMKVLAESGIVIARKEGKWTYYRLSLDGIKRAKTFLLYLAQKPDYVLDFDGEENCK